VRDQLALSSGLTEEQAAASVEALAKVLCALEPEELLAACRHVRRVEKKRRDMRIRAALRTGNASEVAKREGVSVSRVYEIANARRQRQA
jgi:hypothetical protein